MTDSTDTTVERWLPIPGYEGLYSVSNFGRIRRDSACRSTFSGRILKPNTTKDGYKTVELSAHSGAVKVRVHVIVLAAFVGPVPNGYETNHVDFDRANNKFENLEYVTHKENCRHSQHTRTASLPRGEKHYQAKLTEHDVRDIRDKFANHVSLKEICTQYTMSSRTIRSVLRKKSWAHVD